MTEPGCNGGCAPDECVCGVVPTEVIDVDFESGGSGQGCTWHKTASECPRRLNLQQAARKRAEESEVPCKRNWEAMFDADKGTVFHRLAEMYHGRNWVRPDQALEVPEPGAKPAFDEGIRLFNGYREHFPIEYWGQVIGTEVHLPIDATDTEVLSRITAKLGYPLPVKIDLVVRLSELDVGRIERDCADCGLVLNGPGIYLLDHKTKGQKPNYNQYKSSVQGQAYQIVYNAIQPHGEECKGMIFNFVVAHKELRRRDVNKNKGRSFFQLYTRTPSDKDCEVIGSWILSSRALAQTNFQNLSQCGFCPYCQDGQRMCDQ